MLNITSSAILTTTLSTKGQVVIPKSMRDALCWPDGITLSIEAHAEGVLLTAAKHHFEPADVRTVRGCMNYKGPALSLDDIDRKLASAFTEKWKKENS
jgi:bifunctional DNA-binding transcriptional regulator/antitoxin component of YhaV-PrlF toxin-antitoxin module